MHSTSWVTWEGHDLEVVYAFFSWTVIRQLHAGRGDCTVFQQGSRNNLDILLIEVCWISSGEGELYTE